MAGDARVLLVRRADGIHATGEVCSHLGGPLAEGKLQGDTIECPWHGSRFCVRDGSVVDGPATHPQPRFETRVNQGRIEVRPARA
jgi:nitrite reductase/ring-hydroxylating ferredoxin subunit